MADADGRPGAVPADPRLLPLLAARALGTAAVAAAGDTTDGSPSVSRRGSGYRGKHLPRRASGRSPFAALRTEARLAGAYGLAVAVWAAAGGELPGGRWLAVHLFTLGVVTNLVVAFTRHFGETLTRQPGSSRTWPTGMLNAGVLLLLAGMASETVWAFGSGATMATAAVAHNWLELRRRRTAALGARFGWIVRLYERAHEAFVVGAVLGAFLGLGVLAGSWYESARLAHLHVNILGWGVLTFLATVVFFGPTVLRVRIESGADARAARWLRRGAIALLVAVVALLASALGGIAGVSLRLAAAAGLAVLAVAAWVTCQPIVRVGRQARPSYSGGLLRSACLWLPATLAADAVVVAVGAWRLLDAIGVALLAGVLAQAIVGSLSYVAPLLAGGDAEHREAVRRRLEAAPEIRLAAGNAGIGALVAAVAVGPAAGSGGAAAVGLASVVLVLTLGVQVGIALARPVTWGEHRAPATAVRVGGLAFAGMCLLVGMYAGLTRIGVSLPAASGDAVRLHGPLVVVGFLGTLIGLERAVGIARRWAAGAALAAPLALAALVVDAPTVVVGLALTAVGGVLVGAHVVVLRAQPSLHAMVMAIGAVAWPAATAVWAFTGSVRDVVGLLTAFLVLTIVGERLDLSRLTRPSGPPAVIVTGSALVALGAATATFAWGVGVRVTGVGLVLVALWLARHDVARVTLRRTGLPRYVAAALLAGYGWLGFGGVLWAAGAPGRYGYDAMVHTVLLGFVISMVFAHAPVIGPALLRVPLTYRPLLYVPLALLHATLAVRVAGDLVANSGLRLVGAVGNVAAVVVFLIVAALMIRKRAPGAPRGAVAS